jgi:hypothetical protein
METAPFVAAGTRKQADLDLIADAPRLAEENERLRALLAAVVKWSDDREVSIALVEDIRAALAGREEGSK